MVQVVGLWCKLYFFSFLTKQQNKGKKKKKGVLPGGGLKAKLKDDLADYGEFDGGYAQDYEDFMWPRLNRFITFAICWTIHLNSMTLPRSQARYQNHARKLWTLSYEMHNIPSKRFMQRIKLLRYFFLVYCD